MPRAKVQYLKYRARVLNVQNIQHVQNEVKVYSLNTVPNSHAHERTTKETMHTERNNNQMRISDFNLPLTLKEMYAKKKAKRKQSKPEFSRFKCKFWYLDGNTSVHYSYDYTYRYPNGQQITVYDESRGFWLLIKHIRSLKAQDLFKTCVIWSNNDDCNLSTDSGRYDYTVAKSYRQKDGRIHPNLQFVENKENNLLLPIGLRERFDSVQPYKMLMLSLLINSPELK